MREVGWWMGSGRFGLRCGVCDERVCGHLYKQIDARDKHRQVGVDEEEHEELAIVEADRVDHPRAKVVPGERVSMRRRGSASKEKARMQIKCEKEDDSDDKRTC